MELTFPFFGLAAGLWMLVAARHPAVSAAPTAPQTALGSITGVVQDRHGDPIPGAKVVVLGDSGETVAEEASAVGSDGTLSLGEFRIDQLPGGTYTLAASAPGSHQLTRIARVPVAPWEDTRVRVRIDLGY